MESTNLTIKLLNSRIAMMKKRCSKCMAIGPTKAGLCEAKCYPKHQKELALARVGEEYVDSKGYTRIYVLVGDDIKIAYKHRHLYSQMLGRPLYEHETVLFRDNDKSNLDPSNLVLGLKGGIPLDEVECPHCERKYGNGRTASDS